MAAETNGASRETLKNARDLADMADTMARRYTPAQFLCLGSFSVLDAIA